jgi:enoyl-CoA hydratase/carnithine racemase
MELFKPTIAAVRPHRLRADRNPVLRLRHCQQHGDVLLPEVSIGAPTIVGAIRLPPRVGWANASELLPTGKPIGVERAKEIGLVWRVVEAEELQAEAMAWARTLTWPRRWRSGPPRRWRGGPPTWAGSSRCASVR